MFKLFSVVKVQTAAVVVMIVKQKAPNAIRAVQTTNPVEVSVKATVCLSNNLMSLTPEVWKGEVFNAYGTEP